MLPNNQIRAGSGQAVGGFLSKITAGQQFPRLLTLAALIGLSATVQATVLTSGTFTSGSATSCMVFSNGTSWSGGAVGVQGSESVTTGGGSALAANVAFKFNIGSFIDSLNSTYGTGNWAVSNIQLSFQYTLYANNNRFNSGAGTFDIYWVATDSWVPGTSNPTYATTADALSTWSGGQSLLATEYYDWTTPGYTGTTDDLTSGLWVTDKSGIRQSTLSYDLGSNTSFLDDILTASASGDDNISLYLMSTSDSLGLIIFTSGTPVLPTLSFDVVSVPEPATYALALLGAGAASFLQRRRRAVTPTPDARS